ncbi:MAG TPA: protease pro-enzyme activation domain-containing protein [Acidimicrobiales bacterium]|nr:protease pro-enzyme activation domain-containing protein [Acidimicrobiales bacterium]
MAVSITALGLVPPSSAGATTNPVRVGGVPRPEQGAIRLTPLPREAEIKVDVTLQPRDPTALATYARAVSSPGSSLYRHYLAPGQFDDRFGPTTQAIQSVDQALRAAGLHPGTISGNHLSIPVRASAAELSAAFSTGFQQYRVRGGRVAYANTAAPLISADAAPYVQSVVGLDDLNLPTPAGKRGRSVGAPAAVPKSGATSGGPAPCSTAVHDAQSEDSYTSDQLAAAYGFSGLYSAGDLGAGQAIALLEFQGYSASDIATYQSCYGTDTPVTAIDTDGGPSRGSGVGEADGDMENIIGLAPGADILVYQAPDTGSAWLDEWNTVVSQDKAKVISISWGLCEQLSSTSPQSENTILEQAATQGETFLAADGDSGSEDCLGPGDENDYLAVDDPGSQPYMTAVGGTEWTAVGTPPAEKTWNDGVVECGGEADCFGAGGGGISQVWTMPSYQKNAAPDVDVVSSSSSRAPCGAPAGSYCRQVPDVSALAGEFPYLLYVDGSWGDWGGTSFAAPLWAALISLTNASSSCRGTSVGFANPALYRIAGSEPSAFNDITSGDNDISGGNGGSYRARAGYDMATGLGSPNGAVLSGALCAGGVADPVSVTSPGPQTTYLGQSVHLPIGATDADSGRTLDYSALGLPAGLTIGGTSGLITGQPTTSALSTVLVTVEDSAGNSGSAEFTWSVPSSITSVKPAYGPAAGNTRVTIKGSGFGGVKAVHFGSTSATGVTVNKKGTTITALSPPGHGAVGLTVTGSSGTSLAYPFDFGPAVTTVSPASGAPGKKVTLRGTNFTGASVSFAPGINAPLVAASATRITVDVPSGATSGSIIVTTPGGSATGPFKVT